MKPQELDFRIWDNKNKRLLYAGNEPIAIGISECSKQPFVTEFNELLGHQEIKDCEIELWIRLKDKNGVKIYEGDIVKAKERIIDPDYPKEAEPFIAIVKKYHDDSIPLYFMMYKTTNNDVFDFEYYEVEVIGNIHENSELLKGVK